MVVLPAPFLAGLRRLAATGAAVGALALGGSALAAHPGHGSKVVLGTLVEATLDAAVIETRDPATLAVTRVRVTLDRTTRFRIGKETLVSPDAMVGARVIATVDYEDGEDGQVVYTATELRFPRPKAK
jgi:hypothetical protein